MFYVYIHIRKDTGEPFYVGKGHGTRALYLYGRSKWWNKIVKKHGLEVEIPHQNLSEQEAMQLEMLTIADLSTMGISLCNMTEGGDGLSGYKHSKESKLKMREAKLGKPVPWQGKKQDPKHTEKIASQRRGIPKPLPKGVAEKISAAKKGKPFSEAHKQALKKAWKNRDRIRQSIALKEAWKLRK